MVERLNNIFATMLSSNENEHHTNWDVLLFNVTMVHRSAEHERTGCTPNRFMLGRKVTTPLDPIYEQSVTSKSVPGIPGFGNSRIAWWKHIKSFKNMLKGKYFDKKYHDKKLSWEQFSNKVLVYFPVLKKNSRLDIPSIVVDTQNHK
jgi:hypothetical protein